MKDGEEEVNLKKDGLSVWGMREMAVSDEMTSDREWREKTCCADPKWVGKRSGRKNNKINLTSIIAMCSIGTSSLSGLISCGSSSR
jgi:hypothetical protein